jgi:hypothetical protein
MCPHSYNNITLFLPCKHETQNEIGVGVEVLTAEFDEFWLLDPESGPVIRGTCRLHLQGKRINRA